MLLIIIHIKLKLWFENGLSNVRTTGGKREDYNGLGSAFANRFGYMLYDQVLIMCWENEHRSELHVLFVWIRG